jgi:hypothetical protein
MKEEEDVDCKLSVSEITWTNISPWHKVSRAVLSKVNVKLSLRLTKRYVMKAFCA